MTTLSLETLEPNFILEQKCLAYLFATKQLGYTVEGKHLTTLSIKMKGFRGFADFEVVELATPDGTIGSGMSIFVGANNAGKSSVLEALGIALADGEHSFPMGKRNFAAGDAVEIEFWHGELCYSIKSLEKGSSETKRERKAALPIRGIFLPSKRYFQPVMGKTFTELHQYANQIAGLNNRGQFANSSSFHGRLFKINSNPDLKGKFNGIVKQVLGYSLDWGIDQHDNGNYFLKVFRGITFHSSEGLGEGLISLFVIIDALYESKPDDIITIDEPEFALHPQVCRRLSMLLQEYAKDRHIVIATHSPYFIEPSALANGAKLFRVSSESGGIKIHGISTKTHWIVQSMRNRYNPHCFGLDAREIFFAEDKILLMEGQEDVVFFPDVIKQLDLDLSFAFFGWGAGGAENMIKICQTLKELGFKKVCVIYDGDMSAKKEAAEQAFPEFKFFVLPADDIRDKYEKVLIEKDGEMSREERLTKNGVLDKNSIVKPEHKDKLKLLLEQASEYLKS